MSERFSDEVLQRAEAAYVNAFTVMAEIASYEATKAAAFAAMRAVLEGHLAEQAMADSMGSAIDAAIGSKPCPGCGGRGLVGGYEPDGFSGARAIDVTCPDCKGHQAASDAPFTETLNDIAQSLFSELCEGDGEHSEALDRALIRKHLDRAITAASDGSLS